MSGSCCRRRLPTWFDLAGIAHVPPLLMCSGTLSSGAILAGAVMAGGLSAAEQAVIAANSSADVFAGPTLDLSRLPTLFTLLTDYPEENTWPSVPLEAAAGDVSAANATANATAAA